VRAASGDADALVRRAAARAAAEDPSSEATELLRTLLDDPDWTVGATAIEGLGSRATPEVRALLAARASDAPPLLRPAYLRAVGRAGGEGARDVLVLALAEADPKLQLAAVEGLAELADPGTASVLVSVLARGRGAEWSEPARRGLARIGAPAWPQLLRVAGSSKSRGQRDATLLLSEQGVPEAAPILITLLSLDPGDALVAEELAVLSCVDHRQASDPPRAWWEWWDLVVHDDALAWFRAGLEREGLRAPEAADLASAHSLEAALFLVDVIAEKHPWPLAERARRELERFLGGTLERLPDDSAARARRADLLRLAVRSQLEAGASGSTDR
jgi:HEAT repeat protein